MSPGASLWHPQTLSTEVPAGSREGGTGSPSPLPHQAEANNSQFAQSINPRADREERGYGATAE